MAITNLKVKFATKGHSIKKMFDCRVNVKDRIEYLRFGTNFEENAIGISYITSPGLDVDKNILINEVSTDIPRNNAIENTETVFYSDKINFYHASFMLTDIFKKVDNEDVALYLRHELKLSQSAIDSVQVVDENGDLVDPDLWSYIDESSLTNTTSRYIYTNLKCQTIKKDGSYESYYVKYKHGNDVVVELLDTKPFYEKVPFETSKNNRQYILVNDGDHFQLIVVFDSRTYSPTPYDKSQRFGLKITNNSVIKVEKPNASLPGERWYLRIIPGDFKIGTNRYWVPEFYNQLYSPVFPYRRIREKALTKLNDKLFSTDTYPISNLGITGFFVDIVMKDKNGKVVRAFSNDPDANIYKTRNGFVTNIVYEKNQIESVSSNSGFIKMKESVPRGMKLYATYTYEETAYTYEKLSVNPSINPEILGKRIIFYCKPNCTETSIHHLIVEEDGRIITSSETKMYESVSSKVHAGTLTTIHDPSLLDEDYYTGYELEILSGDNSGRKIEVKSYNPYSKVISLTQEMSTPLAEGTFYRINKKINGYTTYDSISNTVFDYFGWEETSAMLDDVKLADVHVVQTVNINDIDSYDSRIVGGGVSENQIDNALKIQSETKWYWDIGNFDGDAYPGMASILIELPRKILKEMGGAFSRDQVTEIVGRHIGEGIYPVIRYYDKSTEVTKVVPGDSQIYLEWRIIDATEYRIYAGNSADNLELKVTEPGTRGKTILTGLENNKVYYIQVEPIVGGIARLRSRSIAVMPFSYAEGKPSIKYGQGNYGGATYE
jgi:hypothetical protein